MIMQERRKEQVYSNVAISGLAGTGSTTLLKQLRTALEPYGWTGYSGGEYMRLHFAPQIEGLKHHSAEAYSRDVDRAMDMRMREELSSQQQMIVESWLAGFLAQGLPHVLKVLVICSDDLARADRLALRDGMSPGEAFMHAFHRLQTNFTRWSEMYAEEWREWVVAANILPESAKISFYNPRLYDLTIDTAASNQEEALNMVLEKLRLPSLVV